MAAMEEWDVKKYTAIHPGNEATKARVEEIRMRGNTAFGAALIGQTANRPHALYASHKAFHTPRVGELVCLAVGEGGEKMMTEAAQNHLYADDFSRDKYDNWPGAADEEILRSMVKITERHAKLTEENFITPYCRRFGLEPLDLRTGPMTPGGLCSIYQMLARDDYPRMLPHLNAAMREAGITTRWRIAHFLAQLGHESGGLMYWKELGNAAYLKAKPYYPYTGRGPIQLTWKANYEAAGKALGLDLVNNPVLAESPSVGFRTAAWFWRSRNLNYYADQRLEGFNEITRRINGGYLGYEDRRTYLERAREVLLI